MFWGDFCRGRCTPCWSALECRVRHMLTSQQHTLECRGVRSRAGLHREARWTIEDTRVNPRCSCISAHGALHCQKEIK
jgi:hypothetical protein